MYHTQYNCMAAEKAAIPGDRQARSITARGVGSIRWFQSFFQFYQIVKWGADEMPEMRTRTEEAQHRHKEKEGIIRTLSRDRGPRCVSNRGSSN
jgi:hypothetical protein